MYEFEVAHHHNIIEKRKKRLVVLMALDSPSDLHADDDDSQTAAALRQYTYVDYMAPGWLDNLLYALPRYGMGRQNSDHLELACADRDDAMLLG